MKDSFLSFKMPTMPVGKVSVLLGSFIAGEWLINDLVHIPSGGLATVWLKGESGHEGTLFDFKNGEFRPLYKSKSGRMTVRLVRGEMLK